MSQPSRQSERVDEKVQNRLREAVQRHRERHGVSRSKLAQISGLSLWMISMFERGDRQLSLDSAIRVCHAIDLKLWEILKEVDA